MSLYRFKGIPRRCSEWQKHKNVFSIKFLHMKKPARYFTWDSILFIIISIILIISGKSIFLLWWLLLSVVFLLKKQPKDANRNTFPSKVPSIIFVWLLSVGSIFFWLMFGMFMLYILVSISIFYSAYFIDYSKDANYPLFFVLLFVFIIPFIWLFIS